MKKKKHRFVFLFSFSFVLVLLFSILSIASINAVNPTADQVFLSVSFSYFHFSTFLLLQNEHEKRK